MRNSLPLLAAAALCGCASKPVLYPNAHYKDVGAGQSQTDVKDCERLAADYVKNAAAARAAGSTAEGAAMGAAGGAAAGAILGNLGTNAAAGGATGAAVGLVRGVVHAREPSSTHKSFVNRCLSERGYEVVGWQ